MALTCPVCENAGPVCSCPPKAPEKIEIKVWHKTGGGMMINTECLPVSHPMHPYNQITAQGLIPENYGMVHPHVAEFEKKSRSELINEIVHLREELDAMLRSNF